MGYQALLFCPEERTARVANQVLSELDFLVEPCTEPFAAVKKLMGLHFDAIVVDCENEQNAALLFKSARNSAVNQASLAVAIVEGQAGVAKAFRLGANLVLTKPINVEQAKGTLRVARGLLRKGAELGKPASSASAPPKPAFSSLAVPKAESGPGTPAASAGGFELERDFGPKPGPGDAAVLESLPDPVEPAPTYTAQPVVGKSAPSKQYPWQPAARPMAEPMASALRRAAEAAAKPASAETPVRAASSPAGAATTPEAWPSGTAAKSRIPGAASAPAPAREAPWPGSASEAADDILESTPKPVTTERSKPLPAGKAASAPVVAKETPSAEAPSFSMLDSEGAEEEAAGGSKKILLIAAVIVVLAALAGYLSWIRLHDSKALPPTIQSPAPEQAQPFTATEAAMPGSSSATPEHNAPQAPARAQEKPAPGQEVVLTTRNSVPAPAKVAAAESASVSKVTLTGKPEPLVVKKDVNRPAPAQAAPQEQVQAPSAIGVVAGSNADETAISNLVATAPVSVPQPLPQVLKISQGVSQGLLLKRVQPVYPAAALHMHLQGSVQLQATISKDGSITNVKVLRGEQILSRAAVDAVRQWQYKPYYLNGEPVEIETQVTVNFKLPN